MWKSPQTKTVNMVTWRSADRGLGTSKEIPVANRNDSCRPCTRGKGQAETAKLCRQQEFAYPPTSRFCEAGARLACLRQEKNYAAQCRNLLIFIKNTTQELTIERVEWLRQRL